MPRTRPRSRRSSCSEEWHYWRGLAVTSKPLNRSKWLLILRRLRGKLENYTWSGTKSADGYLSLIPVLKYDAVIPDDGCGTGALVFSLFRGNSIWLRSQLIRARLEVNPGKVCGTSILTLGRLIPLFFIWLPYVPKFRELAYFYYLLRRLRLFLAWGHLGLSIWTFEQLARLGARCGGCYCYSSL